MKTLGEKVKDRRVDLGLTQQELANQTGVALKTLTNIEVRGAIPAAPRFASSVLCWVFPRCI